MSRIGRKPITIPDKVKVTIGDGMLKVEGPKGKLAKKIPPLVSVEEKDKKLIVSRKGETREHRAQHGLARALFQNMLTGVSEGYSRKLEIHGTGYRAEISGNKISLNLGYSHPVEYTLPDGVKADYDKVKNSILLNSHDKELLGFVASKIRGFRPPEPYKQKGIRIEGERIRVKVGKTGAK
ncbi:MAG: 50S ribosomal protein L6 [Myxococcota bacterium]